MKISKREIEWEFKTRNRTNYSTLSWWFWHWTFGIGVEIESYHRDYFEINLHVLCFYFSFTSISHKFSKELDEFVDAIEVDEVLKAGENERPGTDRQDSGANQESVEEIS